MNKPTDAEIKDLYAQETGFTLDDSPAALLDFARAVLAKWGTPAPVEREPLTHAQAKALVSKYGNDPLHLVLQVERHHGIKGGQHGTE